MAAIRSKDTQPELAVRKALHGAGFRYRLHRKDLPGTPDIVLPRYRTAVLVHGCFWHGHDCPDGHTPQTNTAYWLPKLEGNRRRDEQHTAQLTDLGWNVEVVYACQAAEGIPRLIERLRAIGVQEQQKRGRGTC